jgi:alpha-D-xyloside xylohydrolase
MPYQEALTPPVIHCADPVQLPVRDTGDCGQEGQGALSKVVSAELLDHGHGVVRLKGATADGDSVEIVVAAASEGVLRIRLAAGPESRTRSAAVIALVRAPGYPDGAIEVGPGMVRVTAHSISVDITLDPWHLRFSDPQGGLLVEQDAQATDISGRLRVLPFGRSSVAGRTVAYHETFAAAADEHFSGLGEKFTAFDKRGQRIVCWNYDAFGAESERSYKNVPFYVSNRGYGVLVDSGMATEVDLCYSTHSCVQIVVPDDLLEYYVIAGPTPSGVIDRYHRLTGRPVPPPKWALGTWISAGFEPDSQSGVLERARTIRNRGIPCDVLHLDAHWMTFGQWADMRWDSERFPDPATMFHELKQMGFRTSLWISPYVSAVSPLFSAAAEKGYLLRRQTGEAYESDVWHGFHPSCGIVDFTDDEATRWYQGLLRPLLEQGADVFKTDFGEGVPCDAVTAKGMSGEELHNVYSLLYNDAVAQITHEVKGHSVVWARSSFTGGQRHCAQWAGDNNATFASMASTLRGGLSYAMSGVPFWSHDVGGFTGTPSPELYVRSAQFGALAPLTRFHGNTARLPWQFGSAVEGAVIDVLRLRYRLMPYLYTAAVHTADSGQLFMRPMPFVAPEEPASWSADLEYLLGPDLLVAPVASPSGLRHVYLPPGDWVDYWSGESFNGPRHLRVRSPLEQIPLFVRRNAVIAMTAGGNVVPDAPFDDVVITCWGDGDGVVDVCDTGTRTRVTVIRDGDRLTATSTGPLRLTGVAFPQVAGVRPATDVFINGVRAQASRFEGWPAAVIGQKP